MQAASKILTCFRCHAEHTEAHYERVVYNRTPLYGPWAGWRMAGRDLVSSDGDRISPQRLAGILWAQRARSSAGTGHALLCEMLGASLSCRRGSDS